MFSDRYFSSASMGNGRFPTVDLLPNPLPKNEGEDCDRIGLLLAVANSESEMA
jgi:hypothetical protein